MLNVTIAEKFKCPHCGSARTKPLSIAISTGTRRRGTTGVSSRGRVWRSSSTYQSDFVSSLPQRPSNAGAWFAIFLGLCAFGFAWLVGSGGLAVFLGLLGVLFVVGGWFGIKPADKLAAAQRSWDRRWLCARCGHQWEAAAQP